MKVYPSIKNLSLAALCALLLALPVRGQNSNDEPAADSTASSTSTNDAQPSVTTAEEPEQKDEDKAKDAESRAGQGERRFNRNAVVVFGKDAELKAGETAEAVVVIGGSAKVAGKVRDAVVAIGGDIHMQNGSESQEAVAVMGGIKADRGSTIHGEAVSVGGKVNVEDGARIDGEIQDMDFAGFSAPHVKWIRDYMRECVMLLRPLAPGLRWLWGLVIVVFLFYLLIAAVFRRPVEACLDCLVNRPATTFGVGILTKLVTPLVVLLLMITVVGFFVLPVLAGALLIGSIVGKVAVIEWVGLSAGRVFKKPELARSLLAFVVGFIVLTLLYMVPVLGFLLFMVMSLWGLGAAVSAVFIGLSREKPARPVMQPAYAAQVPGSGTGIYPGAPPTFDAPGTPGTSIPPAGAAAFSAGSSAAAATLGAPMPPMLPEALSYPRAGFWERMGAGFLDMVLVFILAHFVGGAPLGFLVALAYFAGMWAWRGTTIGGIVLGIKVVRLDGQKLSFPVCLIRALAAAFSIIVLFLGFFWIAWSQDKQGWHDKIAGTAVIKTPHAAPLLVL